MVAELPPQQNQILSLQPMFCPGLQVALPHLPYNTSEGLTDGSHLPPCTLCFTTQLISLILLIPGLSLKLLCKLLCNKLHSKLLCNLRNKSSVWIMITHSWGWKVNWGTINVHTALFIFSLFYVESWETITF